MLTAGWSRPGPCNSTTSPAAMVLRLPSGSVSTRRPASSMRFEAAGQFILREAHADGFADPGCTREPVGADGGEVLAPVPLRQTSKHFCRQRGEQRFSADLGAGCREIGRRIFGIGRMAYAIDADADRDGAAIASSPPRPRSGCRRISCHRSRRSFGHLIASRGRSADATSATASWIASAATNASSGQCSGRRRVGQQQAGMQIAGLRHPGPAAPPAPAGLPGGGDPERPALALRWQAPALRHWSRSRPRGR